MRTRNDVQHSTEAWLNWNFLFFGDLKVLWIDQEWKICDLKIIRLEDLKICGFEDCGFVDLSIGGFVDWRNGSLESFFLFLPPRLKWIDHPDLGAVNSCIFPYFQPFPTISFLSRTFTKQGLLRYILHMEITMIVHMDEF